MLRVVGGTHRSRKINQVDTKDTRPTTDRNKEALFNIIGQYFDGETFLDLFAGSGALGIEAISRGSGYVDFVDNSLLACRTIKANLLLLNEKKNYKILNLDAFRFLYTTENTYDVILVDPPYALLEYEEILKIIVTRHLLKDGGIIVFEANKTTVLPEKLENIVKYKEKSFGNTLFGFYTMEE
ncbi:MAG: 16S rRNA (guanine(966)-N(2))-methyltransferase RsmD [Tenericutes bacterium]|nr:16S rRNA (guanine(966)-N(2))-methyltransferase RsmD [Mycoplasmatota bacterium]